MEENVRIECEFVGVVNGVPVRMEGWGQVGRGEGPSWQRLDLELLTDVVPLGFDPALVALLAADLVLRVARLERGYCGDDAAQHADDDLRLQAHLDFKLLDENYRDMGSFEIVVSVRVDAVMIEAQGQLVKARTRMEPAERLVSVGNRGSGATVALGRDGLVQTATSSFETDFGNGYLGVSVLRVVGEGRACSSAPQRTSRAIVLSRAGKASRGHRVMIGAEW